MLLMIKEIWKMLEDASPYLLFGFLIAGLIHVCVSPQRIAGMMGKRNWKSVLMASICGIPLPLCSCSVLPTAATLREKGASRGATASFLISTPETGVDSISVTYGLMGLPMAIIRPVAAFITAFIAGFFVNLIDMHKDRDEEEIFSTLDTPAEKGTGRGCSSSDEAEPVLKSLVSSERVASCCCTPVPQVEKEECGCSNESQTVLEKEFGGCCSSGKGESAGCVDTNHSTESGCCSNEEDVKFPWYEESIRYAFGKLSNDLAYWLALGFVISGILSAFIPATLFETWIGQGIPSILLMLVISVPLYICASASTPIAAVLIMKGLSPGAALVFLLAGPATNIGAFPVVGKMLGRKGFIAYLSSIVIVTFLFGVGVNAVFDAIHIHPIMNIEHHAMQEGASLGFISALIMLFLIGKGIWLRPMPNEWHWSIKNKR